MGGETPTWGGEGGVACLGSNEEETGDVRAKDYSGTVKDIRDDTGKSTSVSQGEG